VDVDAIRFKVKQEFAAKEKAQTARKVVAKAKPKSVKRRTQLNPPGMSFSPRSLPRGRLFFAPVFPP
jgi:hypothetical protein